MSENLSTAPKPQDPKRLLMDLAKELDGDSLESTFELFDRTWSIRLLTEDESNWRNGYVNTGTKLSTITSYRLPTLAIGIRAIDGIPVYAFFQDEWTATEDGRAAFELIEGKGRFSQKYFAAEHLMEFLADRFPEKMEELWEEWAKLETRREEAQASVKKSSGEGSEEDKNSTGTGSSPSGDE